MVSIEEQEEHSNYLFAVAFAVGFVVPSLNVEDLPMRMAIVVLEEDAGEMEELYVQHVVML